MRVGLGRENGPDRSLYRVALEYMACISYTALSQRLKGAEKDKEKQPNHLFYLIPGW